MFSGVNPWVNPLLKRAIEKMALFLYRNLTNDYGY